MNKTDFDPVTKVAKIEAGSLWEDVYMTLAEYGATAPGGRTATVGVGGFTLGGGNNFVRCSKTRFSQQHSRSTADFE